MNAKLIWYGPCGYWTQHWEKLAKVGPGIPACPVCKCPGFESEIESWNKRVEAHTKLVPRYPEFIAALEENCLGNAFNVTKALRAFEGGGSPPRKQVPLSEQFTDQLKAFKADFDKLHKKTAMDETLERIRIKGEEIRKLEIKHIEDAAYEGGVTAGIEAVLFNLEMAMKGQSETKFIESMIGDPVYRLAVKYCDKAGDAL